MTTPDTPAQSWPEHSCYEWNRRHYVSSPEYTASVCGTCGKITGFRWRRWWKRFFSLVTSEPLKYKSELRFWIGHEIKLWRYRKGW